MLPKNTSLNFNRKLSHLIDGRKGEREGFFQNYFHTLLSLYNSLDLYSFYLCSAHFSSNKYFTSFSRYTAKFAHVQTFV